MTHQPSTTASIAPTPVGAAAAAVAAVAAGAAALAAAMLSAAVAALLREACCWRAAGLGMQGTGNQPLGSGVAPCHCLAPAALDAGEGPGAASAGDAAKQGAAQSCRRS